MNLIQRFNWWFRGEVAEEVHKYEDTIDAIMMPIMAVIVTASLWTAAYWLVVADGTFHTSMGGVTGFVAAISTVQLAINTYASYVYATQETELPNEAVSSEIQR